MATRMLPATVPVDAETEQREREGGFVEGTWAHRHGEPRDANPYVRPTLMRTTASDRLRDAWWLGWDTAATRGAA